MREQCSVKYVFEMKEQCFWGISYLQGEVNDSLFNSVAGSLLEAKKKKV